MRHDYVEAYRDLYLHHWWWRAREDFLVTVLRHYLPPMPHTILDIGCGGGLFFERLRPFGAVYGIEPDLAMRTGRPEIDGLIHWGTLETFKPERRFSVALLLDVLEHLADPVACLRTVSSLLEPGGLVIATVPAFNLVWTRHDDLNDHVTRYMRSSFRAVLQQAGYRVDTLRYFFHWLFPVKLSTRVVEWALPASGSSMLPAVPPSAINRACYLLSRCEQWCHLDRLLPFGSSLLFVGSPATQQSDTNRKRST